MYFGFSFTTANKVVPLRGKVPATRVKRPVVYIQCTAPDGDVSGDSRLSADA